MFSKAAGTWPSEGMTMGTRNYDLEKSSEDWTEESHRQLNQKNHGVFLRNLRYRLMSMYRRIFTLVFCVNLALLLFLSIGEKPYLAKISNASLGNLLAAVLIRNDNIINFLFRLFASMPTTWPLPIRRLGAKIYHLGGLHSGCAIFAVGWHLWLTIAMTRSASADLPVASVLSVSLCYGILVLLTLQATLAYPNLRQKHHNSFEYTHRYFGWMTVFLAWFLVLSLTRDLSQISGQSLGLALITSPAFWFLLFILMSIVSPWALTRKMPIKIQVLSRHACRIYIYDRRFAKAYPGSFVRLSTNPAGEWHSFAAIAESTENGGPGGYSVVVSNAGDWTGGMISRAFEDTPKEIWIRGVPTCGVLHVAKMFRKIVLVATGSGIGPCLAVLRAGEVEARVLWSTREPQATYGRAIVDDVLKADPQAVIYDTQKRGRPDVVKMAYGIYIQAHAEAVIIISNPALTHRVVYGLESRGIPAFGAIWDS
ncbi:Similar to hypothetical protein AOL_s00188g124 [Arthrobotrys oligospora ATCC 24927]; acc. no. EGX44786 [Pyronema omphalodes CBS 100304]|uniref:Integral membrane protein TmpA n=1 Tax=Pyronema omphalodes (strain CBS 100304) TaxID=1076935 RepID=U4LKH5_PYROM|nr:Similar to hypothetical protein AOL_s00188g124 [Arthrobotrys oligospora ATCC 24927]; acc. no. EGX44786 [Pyronema omphalodes CBS 100304]